MKKKVLFSIVLVVASLAVGLVAGFWMPRDDDFFALRKSYQVFGALYEELVVGYVDKLDPEKMMHTGIDAMLQDLDPYTNFYDEADNADLNIMTRGRYGGVGLSAAIFDGKITVTAPVEGTSSYRRGVRPGDVITEVAGRSTKDLSLDDVRNLLRGEPGSTVQIMIAREGAPEPLSFVLRREEVKLKNVPFSGFVGGDTTSGIGYIKLDRFANEAAPEVRRALISLQKTDALKGVILDLRDNPGGLLEAAVEITGLFAPANAVIVSTRGRQPQTERSYQSKLAPLAPDLPLVVLMNGYSASASEIVAGAIQDLDRGLILGTPSFGKGLVQIVRNLPFNTSLKLTTAGYYSPSGRSIQKIDYRQHDGHFGSIPDSLRHAFTTAAGRTVLDGRGIEPDVTVSLGVPSALEQALARQAEFLFYATHFAAEHPLSDAPGQTAEARFFETFGDGDDFEVSDAVYSDFQAWLHARNFVYRTPAEQGLKDLSELLEKGGYNGVKDQMEALGKALQREKTDDFNRLGKQLKARLRTAILAHYIGESAQIRASLAHDAVVDKARRLLLDHTAYKRAFGGA